MRTQLTCFLSACLLLASGRLGATVHVAAEWSELVASAQAITHGRVIDVQPRATADRRRVETLVTLQVATYLKGDWGPTVTFVVPGGRIGRYRTVVLDAPRFVPGEEVVLLLGAQGPSLPYVIGLNQGVFRVTTDPASGRRQVHPVPVIGEGTEWTPVRRGDGSRRRLALTDFARQVERVLGRPQ
jgi:hypothetical protein